MKFIADKQKLLTAVVNVSRAISERSAMQTLEGVKLVLDNNKLELTGYDLEIGIRTIITAQSTDTGSCVINAKLFADMIRKMPDVEILVEISENYQVTVSGGYTKFNLFACSAEEYPDLPMVKGEESISVCQPVLKEMINQTKFAAAVNDIKPILKGELFEIENNMLTLAAIDGYRLAVKYEPIKSDKQMKFVVPSKTLSEITGLLSDNEEDVVSLSLSSKHIIFEIGDYLVYSRLLEGEFHPYKSAIPTECSTEVIVDRKEMIDTLERAMLLINERTPNPVRCTFDNNKVKIKCATSQGTINDEINAQIQGPAIEIGFKCKFLLDPLKVINEDRVKLQMSGSLLPMKIVSCKEDKYIYLVLPVRLPNE